MQPLFNGQLLFALLLALFATTSSALAQPATGDVMPILDCVTVDSATGEATAFFSYDNKTASTVTVAIGADNRFQLSPQDRGQGTAFLAGFHRKAFSVVFDTATETTITWQLLGNSAVASDDPTVYCGGTGPTGPAGPTGPTGPTGATGATGPKGQAATAFLSQCQLVTAKGRGNTATNVTVKCADDERLLSGGGSCLGRGVVVASQQSSLKSWEMKCSVAQGSIAIAKALCCPL